MNTPESTLTRRLCVAAIIGIAIWLTPLQSHAQPVYQEPTEAQSTLAIEKMDIQTASGQKYRFHIEVAKTMEEKERGLMFRKEVAANGGMIFIFGEAYTPYLWMRNTFVPLDMLFLDKDGYILYIKHSAKPHSLEPIGTGGEAWAVVELQGGISKKLGIRAGDRVLAARKPANTWKKAK